MGICIAYLGGILTVYLLIYLQAGPPGLRRGPSMGATLIFAGAVLALAARGCPELAAQPAPVRTLATQYGHAGDVYAGKVFACPFRRGKVQRRWGPGTYIRKMDSSVRGVAHRTLPCGTLIRIQNLKTGKVAVVPVVDRGPYWQTPVSCNPAHQACWNRGRVNWGKVHQLLPGYRWSHNIDVMVSVAKRIGVTKTPVTIQVVTGELAGL